MSTEIGTDITRAAEHIRQGELVGMPTETVYGLAANALDADAVAGIFEAKGRPRFDPLIVHIADASALSEIARIPDEAHETLRALTDAFWPGPLTLVVPRRETISDLVTSGLPTVGVRLPRHPMARALIREAGVPVAAPSANPFGYISPTTAAHVVAQLAGRVRYVLDGGSAEVGLESTILAVDGSDVTQLRPGGTPREAVERVLGRPIATRESTSDPERPESPGQLDSHYAPRVALELVHRGGLHGAVKAHAGVACFAIGFRELPAGVPGRVLAPDGDLRVAARNLFAALREADASGAEVVLAERCPEEGLGAAIADRLRRAAGPRSGEAS